MKDKKNFNEKDVVRVSPDAGEFSSALVKLVCKSGDKWFVFRIDIQTTCPDKGWIKEQFLEEIPVKS